MIRRRAFALIAIAAMACHDVESRRNREAALSHDLFEMRKAIADFRADKHRGPHSLSELKTSHYLSKIPVDPITMARNWRVTTEVAVASDDFTRTAAPAPAAEVIDVHSSAPGKDLAGKPYASY